MMVSLGIIRRIDPLGRLVLPAKLRNMMQIEEQTPLEIFMDGNYIILKKYTPGCIFCGNGEGLKIFEGKRVCASCLIEIKDLDM